MSLTKPGMTIDLIVEEMDDCDTRVTITGLVVKKFFYMKSVSSENSEAEILNNLSVSF